MNFSAPLFSRELCKHPVASVFLVDLTRVKSTRACLPLAGALPRPPRQARPDLQTSAQADIPLPAGFRPPAIGPGKRPPDVCFRVLWQRQKSGTISASHGRRPLRLQALSPIRPDSKNAVCLPPCKTVSRFFLLDLARAKSSLAFPSGGRRVLARPARRGWIYRSQAPPGPALARAASGRPSPPCPAAWHLRAIGPCDPPPKGRVPGPLAAPIVKSRLIRPKYPSKIKARPPVPQWAATAALPVGPVPPD
jgi:hypothetical protein